MALTYKQIQAAAKKKGISQQNVDKFAAMKWVTTPTQPKQVVQPQTAAPTGIANPNSSWADSDIAMARFRKPPTVATPEAPVKNFMVWELTYDANDPEDYLLRLQAKAQTNPAKVTETERYQGMVAQRALNEKQKQNAAINPFATQDQWLQQQLSQELEMEKQRDTNALEEYKKALQAQYETGKQELLQSGERQKEAAQSVLSFSGFGRSSDAVQTKVDIQQKTDGAIQNLNAAMQAEIAMKQAELEWADSDTITALREQINSYTKAAQDRQIEAIKKTAEANAANSTNYMDAVNNLVSAVQASGIDIGSAKDIQEWATLARNADGTINEEFIKTVPADLQAIIRSAAQTSVWGSGEAAKTISVGSWRSEKVYQRNPETNRYDIPVGWAWFGWWGGGWGWAWGKANVPLGDMNSDLLSNLYGIAKTVANSTVRSSGLLDPNAQFKLNYIKSNLTLEKIAELKKRWVSLWALSEWEWTALANTVGNLNSGISKDVALEQINRMIRNAWGVPITLEDAKKGTNPIAPTTPWAQTTTPPASTPATNTAFASLWDSL